MGAVVLLRSMMALMVSGDSLHPRRSHSHRIEEMADINISCAYCFGTPGKSAGWRRKRDTWLSSNCLMTSLSLSYSCMSASRACLSAVYD